MELLAGQWEQENTRRTRRAEHLPYRQIPEHNKAKKELAACIITNNSVKIFWTFSMGDKLKINTLFHKQPYCTLILLKLYFKVYHWILKRPVKSNGVKRMNFKTSSSGTLAQRLLSPLSSCYRNNSRLMIQTHIIHPICAQIGCTALQ